MGNVIPWKSNRRKGYENRGEPINERADTLAEDGWGMSDDDRRWDDRTDRMTFQVRRGDATVSSVWTNSVSNAFRKQAGWAKLQGASAAAAKHWTARVWYRTGIKGRNAGFKEREFQRWGKKCFEDLDQRRMG